VNEWRAINGKLQQDAGRDIEWSARRKKHRDDIKCDLSVIREIAEVGADRCREICRSEFANQSGERTQFANCHQARFPVSASRASLRAPIISMT
jgi:hypothetical protein